MLAPLDPRLAFHLSATVYVVPAFIAYAASTAAAFGEKVPAEPPLSFHPTISDGYALGSAPATAIPRSWLAPATVVHRSAFPVISAMESLVGVTVVVRRAATMPSGYTLGSAPLTQIPRSWL